MGALGQQEAPEGAQIVENSATRGDVQIQLIEIVGDEQQGLFAALGGWAFFFGQANFLFNFLPGFVQGFSEHGHVLVGAFDIVKRCFLHESLFSHGSINRV